MFKFAAITILSVLSASTAFAQSGDVNSCPLTSLPQDQTGTTLQSFTVGGDDGVIYDDTSAALTLMREGGNFASQFHPNTEEAHSTCGADFDEDGWMDFIGVHSNSHTYWWFRNESFDNLPPGTPDPGSEDLPPWNDSNFVLTPKFTPTQIYSQSSRSSGGDGLMCADIDKDGHQDFVYITGRGSVREARVFLGNGDGTFDAPYRPHDNWTSVFYGRGNNSNLFPVDYNNDGYMDFLFGDRETGSGSVQVFLNDQGANPGGNGPQFTPGPFLITNAQMGTDGVSGIAYLDMNGNGQKDLLIGGDDSNKLKFYPGIAGGTVSPTPIVRNTPGSNGHVILVADFSLDGLPDLIVSTEHGSGSTHYIKNNGTAVPFGGAAILMDDQGFYDSDAAFAIDYDHDPLGTLDAIISDGDHSGWGVYANQVVQDYVECGEVESGTLSLGDLSDEEMVITSARIKPDMTLPIGTSVTFYMSNSTPENWVLASVCVDDATAYCASFDKPVGRDVRWKADLCSSTDRQKTPLIAGVEIRFDYTVAEEHFRAGISS